MALFGKGKGTAHVVTRSLVSLELARMTNSFCLELAKVTAMRNEKAQKHRSGLWTLERVIKE